MRIGLFYQIQVPKPWTASSESQRIHEALEQIPFAEQQGFESVWFSEHHFRPVWSHNSAPDLTLAAVSQRTSRIRLGIGVVLAPIHHPLHVAARMATLDILSHGRVDVGLGRTGYPYQLTPYGIGPARHTRHVAGVRRRAAAHLDAGGHLVPGNLLSDSPAGGPARSLCNGRTRRCGRRAAATRRRA